jgi:DNA-binding transcriptional ArsR family regulator
MYVVFRASHLCAQAHANPLRLFRIKCFDEGTLIFHLTMQKSYFIFNHMVKQLSSDLDSAFGALSDPTRRAILERLAKAEATVTELAEPFKISLPAISKHLRVLEQAGLLLREKDGRVHRIRLNVDPLKDAVKWLERYRQFWEIKLDSLAQHLSNKTKA